MQCRHSEQVFLALSLSFPILKVGKFWLHGAVRENPRPIKLCPTSEAKVAKQKAVTFSKESMRLSEKELPETSSSYPCVWAKKTPFTYHSGPLSTISIAGSSLGIGALAAAGGAWDCAQHTKSSGRGTGATEEIADQALGSTDSGHLPLPQNEKGD